MFQLFTVETLRYLSAIKRYVSTDKKSFKCKATWKGLRDSKWHKLFLERANQQTHMCN
jgi:hypothetical protein